MVVGLETEKDLEDERRCRAHVLSSLFSSIQVWMSDRQVSWEDTANWMFKGRTETWSRVSSVWVFVFVCVCARARARVCVCVRVCARARVSICHITCPSLFCHSGLILLSLLLGTIQTCNTVLYGNKKLLKKKPSPPRFVLDLLSQRWQMLVQSSMFSVPAFLCLPLHLSTCSYPAGWSLARCHGGWSGQTTVLSSSLLLPVPQWGAADAEIKVPSDQNTELRGSPFKAWSRSVYCHACYAYYRGFLPC